jgi:RNA polymerase sigma-70 factor (ECF subfamily)
MARHDHPTDAELIHDAKRGRSAAFGLLVERHQDRVYGLCLRLMGDPEDARDAAQEAFVQAFRGIEKFRGDAAFSTWMYRIAVNSCHSLRRRRGPSTIPLDPGQDGREEPSRRATRAPAPDHSTDTASTMDLAAALTEVPEELRAALVLADVEDVPYARISEILGVPLGTVKSRVHRGRVALGRALGLTTGPGVGDREPSGPVEPSQGAG